MSLIGFLLDQELTIRPYKGMNGNGVAIYANAYALKGRTEPKRAKITDEKGREIVASGKVFFGPGVRIPLDSVIETRDGTTYRLVALKPLCTFKEHHVEGWLA